MRLRLFVAVGVPPEVRAAVDEALAPLRSAEPRLRWTDPDHWHLTLAFLGWVPAERLGQAQAAVGEAAAGRAPFALRLDGRLGSFGRRVLWAGLEPSPALEGLARAVRAALTGRGIGFDERPLHAHLTVARAPRERRMPRGLGEDLRLPARSWEVTEVLVMRSHLDRSGARYEALGRAPLGGAPA